MAALPMEYLMNACKQNIDCGMRVVEALAEGATKVREIQLETATEAHAGAVATQKCIAGAADPTEIWKYYSEWLLGSAQKSAAYWQKVGQAVNETNNAVLKCLGEGAKTVPGMTAMGNVDAGKLALGNMIENAYKQWSDATREFYSGAAALPTAPRQPKGAEGAKTTARVS
jgi:hypothetical protein